MMKYINDEKKLFDLIQEYEEPRAIIEKWLSGANERRGFCKVCKTVVKFAYRESNDVWTNLRGQFICENCGFSNRMRFLLNCIIETLGHEYNEKGLLFERVTKLYNYLSRKYNNIIGVEYLGSDKIPGKYYVTDQTLELIGGTPIQHEDMCNLSFDDNEMSFLIHSDVLEHIYDYDIALSECARVLKPGGVMICACPLYTNWETESIAKIDKSGKVVFYDRPLYHGDPINSNGVPVFNNFGFELFDRVRRAGFKSVQAGFDYDLFSVICSDNFPQRRYLMWPILIRAYA